MSGILDNFEAFCQVATIPSKEEGLKKLWPLWGTQQVLLAGARAALDSDVRFIVVLKGRQQGITTLMSALDAYWMMAHPGLQGELIADSSDNQTLFRDMISEMVKSLPKSWKMPVRQDNRAQIAWQNGSRLMYQIASARGAIKTGRGRGLNYLHGTEVGLWPDDIVAGLMSSFAQRHPSRLYVYESTANGYNLFYDMWEAAQTATAQRAIFIGFWRHELNRVERDSNQFKVYWDGRRTQDEVFWTNVVKRKYQVVIEPEQLAWWRWQLAEFYDNDTPKMHQEHPALPEFAFQATGSQFLSTAASNRLELLARKLETPTWYRYHWGPSFEETELYPGTAQRGHLAVWEEPEPLGVYVVGADPAYGSSDTADRYCATVWRAVGGRFRQVAEYSTTEGATYQFAWVLAHLAGAYTNSVLIVELDGPGRAVWDELQRMTFYGFGSRGPRHLIDVMGAIRHYLWRRSDAISPQYSYQWSGSGNQHRRASVLNQLRDALERDLMDVKSGGLIQELRSFRQDGIKFAAHGRAKDDRVIATALAVEGWLKMVVPELEMLGGEVPDGPPPATSVLGATISTFMESLRRRGIEVEER